MNTLGVKLAERKGELLLVVAGRKEILGRVVEVNQDEDILVLECECEPGCDTVHVLELSSVTGFSFRKPRAVAPPSMHRWREGDEADVLILDSRHPLAMVDEIQGKVPSSLVMQVSEVAGVTKARIVDRYSMQIQVAPWADAAALRDNVLAIVGEWAADESRAARISEGTVNRLAPVGSSLLNVMRASGLLEKLAESLR